MFRWFRKKDPDKVALTIVQGDQQREVSVRELALGNKLAGDALLAVLVEKGLVDAEDVRAKIRQLGRQNWRHPDRREEDPS
jgi:hypothetical protein